MAMHASLRRKACDSGAVLPARRTPDAFDMALATRAKRLWNMSWLIRRSKTWVRCRLPVSRTRATAHRCAAGPWPRSAPSVQRRRPLPPRRSRPGRCWADGPAAGTSHGAGPRARHPSPPYGLRCRPVRHAGVRRSAASYAATCDASPGRCSGWPPCAASCDG